MEISSNRWDIFICNVLECPDYRKQFQDDNLKLLKVIVAQILKKIFFQNISIAAEDPSTRHVSTLESIVEMGLTELGGVCLDLNVFLKMILDVIGYDTYNISATWTADIWPRTHVATIVRLAPNSLYLCDVGSCSNTLNEPISINELPYTSKMGRYCNEYRHLPDGKVGRYQIGGHFYNGDFTNGKTEDLRLIFDLAPVKFETLRSYLHNTFTEIEKSHVVRGPVMFRFIEFPEDGASDFSFIMFWGKRVAQGTRNTRSVQDFKTFAEMAPIIRKYWPNIKEGDIEVALSRFDAFSDPLNKAV